MKKTYKEFQEQVLEKTLSPEDIDDLIDKSIEGVTVNRRCNCNQE